MIRERHHRLIEVELPDHGTLLSSAAVRGYPDAAPGLLELLAAVPPLERCVADASGSAGGGVFAAPGAERVDVAEPSYAAMRAARACFASDARVELHASLPWELEPGAYDAVLLLPPTDRGNDRVHAELAAAARALRPGGVAYAAMHKDQGAKRYEREAGAWFGDVSVLRRSRGWRVVRLEGRRAASEGPDGEPDGTPWRRFEALGRSWWALPGVFSARGLDVGSAVLVKALGDMIPAPLQGASVADLGCGTGLLSHAALSAGAANVTALDDDVAAVASARRNLQGDAVRVLHSDLDAVLAPEVRLDVVLVNPPFHVGKQVRLEVAAAFLATAHARLRPGGFALVVANRALPYERELARWRRYETVREEGGFKVLRAWS